MQIWDLPTNEKDAMTFFYERILSKTKVWVYT